MSSPSCCRHPDRLCAQHQPAARCVGGQRHDRRLRPAILRPCDRVQGAVENFAPVAVVRDKLDHKLRTRSVTFAGVRPREEPNSSVTRRSELPRANAIMAGTMHEHHGPAIDGGGHRRIAGEGDGHAVENRSRVARVQADLSSTWVT